MMKPLSRRNFLRFAPVSVGAIALGVAVLPEAKPERIPTLDMDAAWDRMVVAAQHAADPPLLERNVFPDGLTYYDIRKVRKEVTT